MLCFVYPLCFKGVRQAADEILRRPPTYGWLVYNRPHLIGTPGEHALLFEPEQRRVQRLPELRHAKLKRIEGGMLLTGMQEWIGTRPSQARQGWAVATTADEACALVRSLKRKREVVEAAWAARQKSE